MSEEIPVDDILVTVAHNFGDVEVPLAEWIEKGPGPRPLLQLRSARRRSTGEPIPLEGIDDPWRRDPPRYPRLDHPLSGGPAPPAAP